MALDEKSYKFVKIVCQKTIDGKIIWEKIDEQDRKEFDRAARRGEDPLK